MYSSIPNSIGILEYPEQVKGGKDGAPLDKFAYYFESSDDTGAGTTMTQLRHPREFGPGGLDLYYFTFVSSSLRADNQNCLYPGRGPDGEKNTSPTCTYTEDENGAPIKQTNCVPVTFDADTDTGCIFGFDTDQKIKPNIGACLSALKANSPSTLP
jgi:hypothetical protein